MRAPYALKKAGKERECLLINAAGFGFRLDLGNRLFVLNERRGNEQDGDRGN